jgi:alanine racemase
VTPRFRATTAEVDLDAVRRNVRTLKPERAALMAVVKADGYGHGDVPVARAALEAGATWLGVALVEEGIRLRDAGIEGPVLVLAEFPPGSEKDALAAELTPSAYTDRGIAGLADAAHAVGRVAGVHVKVDTGMHRVGLPVERAVPFVRALLDAGLRFEGLWSHFAVADAVDDPFTARQLSRFLEAETALAHEGLVPSVRHVANTAATMAFPESHLDLVRVGIGLYGIPPGPALEGRELRPAMRWHAPVAMTKRVEAGEGVSYGLRYAPARATTIATVAVGYADGYARSLTNVGRVLIRGKRYPVAGTVTMDQTLVDVGDDPVEPGDEVVLLGRQGDEEITANELGGWTGTIGYEVTCSVSPRVPREYRG